MGLIQRSEVLFHAESAGVAEKTYCNPQRTQRALRAILNVAVPANQ